MAALSIPWATVDCLIKPGAVATGDTEDGEEAPSLFASLDKPVVIFVADPTVAMADFEKLETVFQNEKIGLAMKAFRSVRMSSEQVDADPILEGKGKTVPRMLLVDPVKERVKVIEGKKIKVSSLFKAMKSVAGNFYKERLDKLVKSHLKILNERDKLSNEEKVLREKENRLASDDGGSAERKLAKVRKEMEKLKTEIEELASEERDLWKLTPKHKAA